MAVWLVTGCASDFGARIVENLLAHGHRVVGVDNFSGTPDLKNYEFIRNRSDYLKRFWFVGADISYPEIFFKIIKKERPEVALHHERIDLTVISHLLSGEIYIYGKTGNFKKEVYQVDAIREHEGAYYRNHGRELCFRALRSR